MGRHDAVIQQVLAAAPTHNLVALLMTALLAYAAASAAAFQIRLPLALPAPRPNLDRIIDKCKPEPLGLVKTFNGALISGMKGAIDLAYDGRDIPRFYVLETIARVPYFSYLSCLHLYESLGMRGNARLMRVHYAEADNELHHLLIMEALGGSDAFLDRFVAQHLAFAYFWYCALMFVVHPRAAYHLSELVEEHAYATYDAFLNDNEESLKAQPVPEVARRYYEGGDIMRTILREEDNSHVKDPEAADQQRKRWEALGCLYDVFVRIRDDEAAHWDTLVRLVSYEDLDAPEGCEVPELA